MISFTRAKLWLKVFNPPWTKISILLVPSGATQLLQLAMAFVIIATWCSKFVGDSDALYAPGRPGLSGLPERSTRTTCSDGARTVLQAVSPTTISDSKHPRKRRFTHFGT